MRMTSLQYAEWLARCKASRPHQPSPKDAVEREGDLDSQIYAWVREQVPQPAVIHSPPGRRTTTTPGTPDWVLFYKGRVLAIELKDREGKVSYDQTIWHHLAEVNGYTVHIVRCYREFLEIVNQPKP